MSDATELRKLRAKHAHAMHLAKLYPGSGNRKAVKRLNKAIMQLVARKTSPPSRDAAQDRA